MIFDVRGLALVQAEQSLWQDLNFSLQNGQRLGISAPSGYGKSTLARVLARWPHQAKVQGEILFNDAPLSRSGYLPVQLVSQHPERSFNPKRTTGQALADVWQPDGAMLARFLVDPSWLKRKPHQLSGGELARIALLRALDPRTELLIADEITAQLDPCSARQIWQALLALCEQRGLAMIIFSHQPALLAQLCPQVLHFGERS